MPVPANAKAIYTFLISHGLTPNAAAGIVGNIQQESGGITSAGVWPNNWGLIQWTPASRYFSGPVTNLETQLNAILSYIKANGSISNINAHSPNPSAAALYFSTQYERPNKALANNANRMQSAIDVAAAAIAGKWSAGTPTSGSKSGGTTAPTPPGSHTSTSTIPASKPSAPTSGIPTPPSAATLTSIPGGIFDPFNLPVNLPGEIANALNLPGVGSSVLNPVKWLGDLFNSALARDLFKRLGLILLGGVLIIAGVVILSGRQVTEVASKVVPV